MEVIVILNNIAYHLLSSILPTVPGSLLLRCA